MTRPLPISANIPAYNEAGRISTVLDVLELAAIIVIDDGSNDSTGSMLEDTARIDKYIQPIHNETDQGKGESVIRGNRTSRTQCLLLLDADLINLTKRHFLDLISPVIRYEADMTLGLFCNGRFNTDLSHWLTPWITNQRRLCAELFHHIVPGIANDYGLETALTLAAMRINQRIRSIYRHGVYHPTSEFHRGTGLGFLTRARMCSQVAHAWLRYQSRSIPQLASEIE